MKVLDCDFNLLSASAPGSRWQVLLPAIYSRCGYRKHPTSSKPQIPYLPVPAFLIKPFNSVYPENLWSHGGVVDNLLWDRVRLRTPGNLQTSPQRIGTIVNVIWNHTAHFTTIINPACGSHLILALLMETGWVSGCVYKWLWWFSALCVQQFWQQGQVRLISLQRLEFLDLGVKPLIGTYCRVIFPYHLKT